MAKKRSAIRIEIAEPPLVMREKFCDFVYASIRGMVHLEFMPTSFTTSPYASTGR
jgi:hypothetical protein